MYNFLTGHLRVVRLCMVAATLALIAIGIATIYSVGHPAEPSPAGQTVDLSNFWKKQVIFSVVAMIAFIAANFVNYRRLGAISYWIYAIVLLLLCVLIVSKYVIELPFAPKITGTYRWIRFKICLLYTSPSPRDRS